METIELINNNIFYKDPYGQTGGIVISYFINDDQVILLGKSNNSCKLATYESFGGKSEKEDISSLHTAVRELIEEFFNYKVSTLTINSITLALRISNIIIKQIKLYGVSYLINFNGLNFIFQQLCLVNNELIKYNINNIFDLPTYIQERKINDKPHDGLNEIESIHIYNLDYVLNNNVNLRWFTDKIIRKFFITKKSNKKHVCIT